MIGQIARLGKEILKRRTIGAFKILRTAKSRIEIILKIRAEIDLLKRVLLLAGLFSRCERRLLRSLRALAICLASGNLVEQRNAGFEFLQNRVFNDLRIDHLSELELVQRKHADHLHEPRREDLLLRDLEIEFVLK